MLLKKYLPMIGAAGAGVVIAYLIVYFLTAPKPQAVSYYDFNYTGSAENVSGPAFYWDYLNLESGEQFDYTIDCYYCGDEELALNVIQSVGDDLRVFFNYSIHRDLNETDLDISLDLTIDTAKSAFLEEIALDSEYTFLYQIFNLLLGPLFINHVAWTNLPLDEPASFEFNYLDFELVVGDETIVNGFSCRPVTLFSEGDLMYYYCLNEGLGLPVVAEHYFTPDLLDLSITLTSHNV